MAVAAAAAALAGSGPGMLWVVVPVVVAAGSGSGVSVAAVPVVTPVLEGGCFSSNQAPGGLGGEADAAADEVESAVAGFVGVLRAVVVKAVGVAVVVDSAGPADLARLVRLWPMLEEGARN